ncbi:MAG: class I SAM-dependent methyltransferase [Chloroflexota bacterium]|nr:class I SAM-dependent methyltransferase [Chloroflexota bacterium]
MAVPSDIQQQHWDQTYIEKPGMFGEEPSSAARTAAALFEQEGMTSILELGGGHGRDTMYFARQGFQVTVFDYSEHGVAEIARRTRAIGYERAVTAARHDVREPLPVPDASVDACYSHMLFCMAMSTTELEALMDEVWRVLRPGGLHVYTVRNTSDPHYGAGTYRGEGRYETGGYQVHFFDRPKVERLAQRFDLLDIETFDEGTLPRRLFRVTLRKPGGER